MKLILSSCDFRNEKSCAAIHRNLPKDISDCRVLFFPNEKATIEAIRSGKYDYRMQSFGFTKNNIHIFDYTNPEMFNNLDIDVIYISGGNTFATLGRIRSCEFDTQIVRYVKSGVTYIGGSAGAHIASQNIEHVSAFDPVPEGMTEFRGLGLFDGILICHYTEARKTLYDRLKADGKYNTYALTDNDSLVICSESNEIIDHYDRLIDENNDSVHDPEPLKEYMDKWDGQKFIDKMQLNKNKSVLEIGVGTGRLATRTAPLCGEFYGIDISPKTIAKAKSNLIKFENVTLICADFLNYIFDQSFDVIYSSLTFMHIEEKYNAIKKAADLLNDEGLFVLSVDKNQSEYIDYGTRKIKVFPDDADTIADHITATGLYISERYETEFANIFVARKKCKCYCGHDCTRCITYIATQRKDDSLRRLSQRFYKEQFGLDIPLEKFNCNGGRTDKIFELCNECPFIKCCKQRNMDSCNECPEYPCKKISDYKAKYVNKCNQL